MKKGPGVDATKPATLPGLLALLPLHSVTKAGDTCDPALSLPAVLPGGDPVWNVTIPGYTSYLSQALLKGFGSTWADLHCWVYARPTWARGSWLRCLGRVVGGCVGPTLSLPQKQEHGQA